MGDCIEMIVNQKNMADFPYLMKNINMKFAINPTYSHLYWLIVVTSTLFVSVGIFDTLGDTLFAGTIIIKINLFWSDSVNPFINYSLTKQKTNKKKQKNPTIH